MDMRGVWIPLITPFRDGRVDYPGISKLVEHYIGKGVTGLIPLGTTGESPTLDDDEIERVIGETIDAAAGRTRILIGAGGSATHKVEKFLRQNEKRAAEGYLIVCPYYNRPSQEGIRLHYKRLAEATEKKILVYNIPYRTGVNIANETLLAIAADSKNIVGVKDCCANISQTLELLATRPNGFAVLTGDDMLYFATLAARGDGGILASAHVHTSRYLEILRRVSENDHASAAPIWEQIIPTVQLLFREPNPTPLKYILWKKGLIQSPECRLPLSPISSKLREQIDQTLSKIEV